MELSGGSVLFGFVAGLLSTLSPCVLPLLPLVLGPAAAAHRWGAAALAAGVVLSFVAVGLFVATVGFSIGLDGEWFRRVSAVLLAVMGVVLLSGTLQARFAAAGGGVSDWGSRAMARLQPAGRLGGLGGQFAMGLLVGAVWSPCVGPTLGAASVLAAQGRDLGAVTAVMAAFGLGAGLPLLVVGTLSREAMRRWRGRMMGVGSAGKMLLGGGALVVAALILTGVDRRVEAFVVEHSPAWLTRVTTAF